MRMHEEINHERTFEEGVDFPGTFENAAVGIAHVGLDGRWLRVNDRLCEIVGYSRVELLELTFGDITASEDLDRDWQLARAVLRGELTTYSMEKRYRRKNGGTVWVNLTVSMQRNARGAPQYFISIIEDITARKRAEAALLAAEGELRVIADAAPVFLAHCDRDARFVFVNLAYAARFNMRREDIIGKRIPEVLGEAAYEAFRPHVEAALRGEDVVFETEIPYERLGVRYMHCAYVPDRDSKGNVRGLVAAITDVTDRKLAERALAASEARLRLFVEYAPASIAMFDRDMRYIAASRRWLTDFGMNGEDLTGRGHYEVFPEIPERWKEIHRRCLTGAVERSHGDRFEREDGRVQWLRWEVRPWSAGDGAVDGIVIFTEDITELKTLQDRLAEKDKLESLGVLAGGVAHDFNNLLTGILGNASLAQELAPAGSPLQQALGEIENASNRAAHLTRQMLAYAGKGRFLIEPVDVSVEAEEVTRLVQRSISKKIRVRLDLGPDLPRVEADRGQLQQIVLNLVLNAAEAIGDTEGDILIRTSVAEPRDLLRIPAVSETPGPHVCLEVKDSGCGMDEATKARIFDPFFTTKITGRGLGLAAVSGVVRSHRGVLHVESSPGRGSTFRVFLPAIARIEAPSPGKQSDAKHGSASETILVVDDEDLVLRTATAALKSRGYSVLQASSGQSALDIFQREKDQIAVVLLDLSMPGLSGRDVLPRLRELRPDIRVVVTSGYAESEALGSFQHGEVAAFVQKPYTCRQLADTVALVIENAVPIVPVMPGTPTP